MHSDLMHRVEKVVFEGKKTVGIKYKVGNVEVRERRREERMSDKKSERWGNWRVEARGRYEGIEQRKGLQDDN